MYTDFKDEMTVKIGQTWGHEQFFQIDKFQGNPQIPGYDPDVSTNAQHLNIIIIRQLVETNCLVKASSSKSHSIGIFLYDKYIVQNC